MTTPHPVISPKKLIEVALPLDAINAAAAREKSIRHGHPSTLHLWWARRPLAAARAVILSQLVHDPEDLWRCQNPGKEPSPQVKGHWTKARARLFGIIEELVLWENTTNETVLEKAREEIRKSWRETCELNRDHPQAAELFNPEKMPGLHDPFAGGGTIPLEAQRLGLEAYASDLNPVAVLINKAMIEIPPKFAGRPPVNPESRKDKGAKLKTWQGVQGLAEDVRYYGQWMRDEAFKRIGHLYPSIEVTERMVSERPDLKPHLGEELTVVAWLWARTVKSPNPAYDDVAVPLITTFVLSNKAGKESYVEPIVSGKTYSFRVRVGAPPDSLKSGTKAARGPNFTCLISGTPISGNHIKSEAMAGRMGQRLLAIVAKGKSGRVYLSPTSQQQSTAESAVTYTEEGIVHVPIANDPRALWCLLYGLTHFDHLFTSRQLVALTTISNLITEVRAVVQESAVDVGFSQEDKGLEEGDVGAKSYAEAVSLYLAFAANKCADYGCSIATWMPRGTVGHAFSKQAIPMTWDFPEANLLADFHCGWNEATDWVASTLEVITKSGSGRVSQVSATSQEITRQRFVSTDPPYYDNIGYADLSDFFYVWLRRSLRAVFPNLLSTIAVPKTEELVATLYRHGSKPKAEQFFLDGMTQAMHNIAKNAHPAAPVTIYYAFKQAETDTTEGTSSSGWVTFLEAVLRSGFTISGTWPMRTERSARSIGLGTNALASSIVLVCSPRKTEAESISRRQFVRELNQTLPLALDAMTRATDDSESSVAPVDLSQAIIGPGMAVFSKYSAVLEADGTPMTVKTALQLINRFLAEDDFDPDTQFCLHWFEQYKWEVGKFGEADTLARAKGTSVEGVRQSGVVQAAAGQVRLLKWAEYPADWDPTEDHRLNVWETLHQLIRGFHAGGETGAAAVLRAVQSRAEAARQLAYRLYTLCERAGLAEDARAYNELITAWSAIESAASRDLPGTQKTLFN